MPNQFSWDLSDSSGSSTVADDPLATRDHTAAALDRLAQYLRNQPNVASILGALCSQEQDLETAYQQLLSDRSLDSAAGAQLDVIGAIVRQDRGGRSDADYRIVIGARIKLNRCSGTVPEILEIFRLIVAAGATLTLRDEPPAAFSLRIGVQFFTDATAQPFVKILRAAKAAGVNAFLIVSSNTFHAFRLDGVDGEGLDEGHFATAYT